VLDAVQAIEVAGVERRDDFYWTLASVFIDKREQFHVFDQAFHIFWKDPQLLERIMQMLMPAVYGRGPEQEQPQANNRVAEALQTGLQKKNDIPEQAPEKVELDATLTFSSREVLQQADFETMTNDELAQAKRIIANLRLPIPEVLTRRMQPDANGRRIDLRATLRASFRDGGRSIPLKRRSLRREHPPLVVLCDISGSMNRYSRVFLHFLHALGEERGRVHTFLFGTRLTNVTRSLRHKDPDEALAACTAHVEDWSGGTRIGATLHEFNRLWSRRVLGQGASVLLFTDGLERDGSEELGREMERLHKSCRRLIWLNPLLRYDRFEPRAQGIRAILPHVDEFRPVHNLASITDLVGALSGQAGAASTDPRLWLRRTG
jgi:uncharacterized protein with von Willebrand factor type A (vWA) domain